MTYWIVLGMTIITSITGMESAYEIYHKACELAELIGSNCVLVNGETGEVIEEYEEE